MKPFILVTDGFNSSLFKDLKNMTEFDVHPESKLSKETLFPLLKKANALIIRSATQVNEELLNEAPQLKLVIRAGEGTDNIDVKACQKRGVKVANTPGANNNSAAEHAIALMFTLLRKTHLAHQSMQKGEWNKDAFTGNELTHKTVGIVGFGKIGQILAKRIGGFEPKVLFFDPFIQQCDLPYAQKVETLEELFRQSDIISIHVPLMAQTRNLIGKELLNMMKPTAILVNAARGNIVDEEALVETLSQKKIKGAAFDVFAKEPLESDSQLRSLPNLVLSPHLGASTDEAQVRVGEMALHQVREFFLFNNLLNEVLK